MSEIDVYAIATWVVLVGIWTAYALYLLRNRCEHKHTRRIYGDEILQTMRAWRKPSIARVRCVDCGKALYDKEFYEATEHYE